MNVSHLMECARIITPVTLNHPLFLPPVHFLAPHAKETIPVHHRSKVWFLFIRLGSSRDFPASSSIDFPVSCYMRAPVEGFD
jgi:hypothetical protein